MFSGESARNLRPVTMALVAVLLAAPVRASRPAPSATEPASSLRGPSGPELRMLGRRVYRPVPKRVPTEIRLANGIVFDTRLGEPAIPERLRAREATGPDERTSLIVQVESPVETSWVRELEAAGARVEFFLPNAAFLCRLDARDRSAVEALPFVLWVGAYHPAYRISGQEEMLLRAGRGEYALLLFGDGDMEAVLDRIRFLGGRIEDYSVNEVNRIVRLTLDRDRVEALVSHPDVQWIEPREHFTVHNTQVQWVDQTNISNNRKVWDNGLTGSGQVVMVGDSGIRTTHNAFRDASVNITSYGDYPTHRKIIAYIKGAANNNILFGDTSAAAYHGTHTDGTFVGNDEGWGTSTNDGMAKDAKVYFLDCGGSSNSIFTPGDLNDYYQPAYDGNSGGAARVSSNSWGANTGGAYTLTCMTTDQFAWNHKDFLICFSNGNAGGTNTVGSPASAKSILSSGGTRNGSSANLLYNSTSRGPTDDNRFKPTVCSPGQSVISAWGGNNTSYVSLSGTSMSCPNLAGSAVLVRQYFMDGYHPTGVAVGGNAFTPTASLVKAMLVNSGVDDFSAYSIPDNNIGWGRILLDNVLHFPGDARNTVVLDETDGVVTGEVREYEVYVADPSEDLKITLVWTDFPSTPTAAINLVNDLDLVVQEGANTYLGNVWSGGQSVTGGTADDRNVEENVRRATPVVGNYTIRVEGANVPFGPQPFALVISGGLGGDAGVLALDAGAYGPGESVGIRVEDTDAGGSVTVSLTSDTEPVAETLVIPGANGVYEGTFPLTVGLAAPADGALSVSNGDLITVSYVDATPSHTTVATASVDSRDPVITNVAADPAGVSAVITWTTDTYADSQVEYGTTPALGSLSVLGADLVTSHSHLVEGLQPETTYFFDVLSSDHQGNLVRDDFGGAHYRFTTGKRADVLLVLADVNTTENTDRYATAFQSTGWTFNTWGKEQADTPEVGDSTTGLRSYKAVWWQVGWEQYPQFLRPARDSLTVYHDGGARLAFVSHDVAWAFSVLNSGFYSATKKAWFESTMHAIWNDDPATFSQIVGVGGDPISGGYTGGVAYAPHRSGAAGDEVDLVHGTGTASYVWRNNDVSVDDIAVRWENGVPNGTAGNGIWGGTPTKTVSMFLEWLNVNASNPNDPVRADILDRTIQWLIGGDHPDALVVAPNGGEVFTTSPVSISWTAVTDTGSGRNLASTRLEYSDDGGRSWSLISASPGSSPYSWDVSALSTGTTYRVRVVLEDDGTPPLSGVDASDADFAIAIPGNENRGPVVIAGSPDVTPDPILRPDTATLTATITDALTGGSNVTAAEWSAGTAPAAPGNGTAMSGSFGTVEVAVTVNLDSMGLPTGATSLWIRGQDAAGNWGEAGELSVQVNGGAVGVASGDLPVASFALGQNSPNPFLSDTRIRFALPDAAAVDLRVYNVQGRLVRTLVDGPVPAGRHVVAWDGRDERGRQVSSGVYFYRLRAGRDEAERKMVLLK